MLKQKVLIADHNPLVRKQVKKALGEGNLDIYEVTSGGSLLDEVRNIRPNLIILEARLPGNGGRNIFKALKGEDGMRSIPVILLKEETPANNENVEQADGPASEPEMAFEVFPKPLDSEALRQSAYKALTMGVSTLTTADEREGDRIPFSDLDFTRFQEFLMAKIGMFFDVKRKKDLARALDRRVRAIGLSSYSEYFDYLTHSAFEEKELRNLILHLTIGETTFFRSPDQFVALREHILPQIIKSRDKASQRQLTIWSSGCSTGEEPYSLAITLKEVIPDIDRWDIRIHATDINQKFLKFAQRGVYPARKVKYAPEHILKNYFTRKGEEYIIDPSLKKYIKFSFHNLSSEDYSAFIGSDIIFCRNVLIYFKRDRIREVIDKFKGALHGNGYLMLGYSETLFQISEDFTSIHYKDAFYYHKASPAEREQAKEHRARLDGGWYATAKHFDPSYTTEHVGPPPASIDGGSTERSSSHPLHPPSPPNPHIDGSAPPTVMKPAEITIQPRAKGLETPNADPEEIALWEKGMEHYFNEQFAEAEEIFEVIAHKFQGSPRALLGGAFIYANMGKDEEAKLTIERVNEIDDLLPESYYLMALLDEKAGDMESATLNYHNVILLDPEFAMAHFNLAIIYMKQGRMRDSRREFANTLEILKRYETNRRVKFSGGLHREALMQLCEDLE